MFKRMIILLFGLMGVTLISWAQEGSIRDVISADRDRGPRFRVAGLERLNVIINQKPDTDEFPRIKAFVSVTDSSNQPINGLTENEFIVEEDGREQSPISVVSEAGNVSVSVALLMDYSGSMSDQAIKDMEAAADTFVNLMTPQDQGAIFKFADSVYSIQKLTSDKVLLHNAIHAPFRGGRMATVLYDAIYEAATELRPISGRKAIIALTDGKDNKSKHPVAEAIAQAIKSSVPVFTIGLGTGVAENILTQIANSTGGQYYYAPTSSELEAIYQSISMVLSKQYLVSYTTDNLVRDGSWRTVCIHVTYGTLTDSATTRYRVFPLDTLTVSIPKNLEGQPGDIVLIPVYISDAAGKGVDSAEFTVSYDGGVLEVIGLDTTGSVASHWVIVDKVDSGQITVVMAGATPLTQGGILAKIICKVVGSPDQTTDLHFTHCQLNEGLPHVKSEDGAFQVIEFFHLSGKIAYYSSPSFDTLLINRAKVHLSGARVDSTVTDVYGKYDFSGLRRVNYTVIPYKTGDLNGCVTAFDASYILRYCSRLLPLQPLQRLAADVTGDDLISIDDARKILRYRAGYPSESLVAQWTFVPTIFPIDSTNWAVAPCSLSFAPLKQSLENQNFCGLVYGDVTGNWLPRLTQPLDKISVADLLLSKVEIPEPIKLEQNRWRLPIKVRVNSEVYSMSLSLEYDSNLKVIGINKTYLTRDYILVDNIGSGKLSLAMAGSEPVIGSGNVIEIEFETRNFAKITGNHSVKITELSLNELESSSLSIEVGLCQAENGPVNFSLAQNYPNPFNSQTIIKYQLPEKARVILEVCNLLGQRVRVLVDEEKQSGYHQVGWDGRDESGRLVSSGLYLYRLQAENFVAIKKMALLR